MTMTRNRRQAQRFDIPADSDARVRFDDLSGAPHDLRIVDISLSSICFAFVEDLPDLEVGAEIPGATIRLDEAEMRGDLLVMHVTANGPENQCGAMFYPKNDEDLKRLREAVTSIEAGQPV